LRRKAGSGGRFSEIALVLLTAALAGQFTSITHTHIHG
jgi:hypothetical protein